MKLLVAPHDLNIGGSQINAIDLAAGVSAAGHDVSIYGKPGPLVDYIESRGLRLIAARPLRYRPAPSRIAQLAALARRERLDLIHAYEWPPCLDAYYGAHLLGGVPLLCTVLSMSVSPFVPPSIPLVMGTRALAEEARPRHRAPVWALEPPIDTVGDSPSLDGAVLRRSLDIAPDRLVVVTVSRLAVELKLDALVEAIDAIGELADVRPVELVVVGDGPAGPALRARADRVNQRCGRPVIKFTGSLADPRPAYAAADLVLGMGSSALRAMAISKPVIAQGERGFSKIVEPETLEYFLTHGFWGVGDGSSNVSLLSEQIGALLDDAARRDELARFGRATVEERFSLERAVRVQLELYEEVSGQRVSRRWGEATSAAGRALRMEIDNHNPFRRRAEAATELARLAAAQSPPLRERPVAPMAVG